MSRELTFEVSRTIVVRAVGHIDRAGTLHLRRILEDLIDDHEVRDLVVDFTQAPLVDAEVSEVLEWAQQRMGVCGGRIELRLPSLPDETLIEASAEIASFVPLDDTSVE